MSRRNAFRHPSQSNEFCSQHHMKDKIGILTFHNGPNYGGFMQAWHLRSAIEKLGHDVTVINYLNPVHHHANHKRVPITGIGSVKTRVHWIMKRLPFRKIVNDLCDHPFTTNPSDIRWNDYRRIVVGSDVVWDFSTDDYGHDPAYFGMAPGQNPSRMMSYAASCGPADSSGPLPRYCEGLKDFIAHGVRDGFTANLVTRVTGQQPHLVVDPTWLGDDPKDLIADRIGRPYVLIYGTSAEGAFGEALAAKCKDSGLKIISAAARCSYADKTIRILSPFQWLNLIRGATATVIGGLHGTLYSIKYKKPFVLIVNENTRQKASRVLERTQQQFRQVNPCDLSSEHLDLLFSRENLPDGVPKEWKEESLHYLASHLAQ